MAAKRRAEVGNEFRGADFKDARLSRRLGQIVERLAESPDSSFPQVFENESELEAVYRFLGNKSVDLPRILAPHVGQTIDRCGVQRVVVAHDTTVVSFRFDGKRQGLATINGAQQFRLHTSLAVTADAFRDPLGVLACEPFIFDCDGGDGSHQRRWFEQVKGVEQLKGMRAELVHVMDREADDYPTLVALQQHEFRFVIRCAYDRMLAVEPREVAGNIGEALARACVMAAREVPISRRGKVSNLRISKTHPGRDARVASLQVSAMTVELKRPTEHLDRALPNACEVNIVRVWEPSPPEGEVPVEWLLYTNEPIETGADLLAIVDAYRTRWRIEEFFKALKTGCSLERRQLESYQALTAAAGILLPLAWRLLRLRSQTHLMPEAPASTLFDEDELAVLRARSRRPLPEKLSRRDALLAIAALGGHLKRNGEPGWQTLGGGLEKLLTLVEGFRIANRPRRKRSARTYDQ
jgi:hypothetical protein